MFSRVAAARNAPDALQRRLLLTGGMVASMALAACSGGGGSTGSASSIPSTSGVSSTASNGTGLSSTGSGSSTTTTASSSNSAQVQFGITVPSQSSAQSTVRNVKYISASTRSAIISITNGTNGTPVTTTVSCTTTCSAQLTAPVGIDTFSVSLYDQSNGQGNVLSQGSTTANIVSGQTNLVNIIFGGVVSTITLTLEKASVTPGVAAQIPVLVTAYDADHNIIVGAQPLSSPIVLKDSDSSNSTSLSPTTLTTIGTPVMLTYNGGALSSATISATMGNNSSVATTPTVLSATVASANVPAHMMTYAVLPGNFHNVYGVDSPAAIQSTYQMLSKYINFMETDNRVATVAHAAGIKVGFYTDPVHPHGGEINWSSAAFAHDCSGQVVYFYYPPAPEVLGDVNSPALASAWDSEIQGHLSDQWGTYPEDFVRSDDSGTQSEGWERFFSGSPTGTPEPAGLPYCGYTQSSFISGIRALFQQSPIPVIFNGDAHPLYNAYMQNEPNVLGSQCESCFYGWQGTSWQQHVDAEIGAVGLHKVFNSFSHENLDAPSQTYLYASLLLGFDPNYVSLKTDIATNSGVPETALVMLVPTLPTLTATDVSQYLLPEGVYARQFGACYINRQPVGPCASVVNSDYTAHPFPASLSAYHHTAVVSGTGIISELGDTGSVSASGPAPPSTIAPSQAFIVFQ